MLDQGVNDLVNVLGMARDSLKYGCLLILTFIQSDFGFRNLQGDGAGQRLRG
jgi:hypothetical protein